MEKDTDQSFIYVIPVVCQDGKLSDALEILLSLEKQTRTVSGIVKAACHACYKLKVVDCLDISWTFTTILTTLGARVFSYAVSGFGQVFILTRMKRPRVRQPFL